MSDGCGMTVLCSSVSAFRIFGKDVKLAKLGIVENVLGYFIFVYFDKSLFSWLTFYS